MNREPGWADLYQPRTRTQLRALVAELTHGQPRPTFRRTDGVVIEFDTLADRDAFTRLVIMGGHNSDPLTTFTATGRHYRIRG